MKLQIKERVKNLLFIKDGGKFILNLKHVGLIVLGVAAIMLAVAIFFGHRNNDTSFLGTTNGRINKGQNGQPPPPAAPPTPNVGGIKQAKDVTNSGGVGDTNKKGTGRPLAKVNFAANQIISRDDAKNIAQSLTPGMNLIGKLINTIDTRIPNTIVKVLLPYGSGANSGGILPPKTVVFGRLQYGGSGERIFILFNKGMLPTKETFPLNAQALNAKDYSPGLIGDYYDKTDVRLATTMGLTMVSQMTDVLAEKEALGADGFNVAVKPTMKNAIYKGVSKVTEDESQRQAEKLNALPEYAKVNEGTELIVNIMEPDKKDQSD